MSNKAKIIFVLTLLSLQVIQNIYFGENKLNIDFLYLIVLYVTLKSDLFKTALTATLVGWFTDFYSGGVIGVFGFSRTLVALFIRAMLSYIDLRKGFFVFLMITLSLSFSNLISNVLFMLIFNFDFNLEFVIIQPCMTGVFGFILLKNRFIRKKLDVY